MKHITLKGSLFCAFSLNVFFNLALAQKIDLPQCQTSVIGPQKIQAQSQNLSDPQRIFELDQLLIDFRSVRENLDAVKRLPKEYIETCLKNKQAMVDLHYSKLSEATKNQHRTKKLMAETLDVNFRFQEAIKFYDEAYAMNNADTESALKSLKLSADLEFEIYSKNQNSMTRDQKIVLLTKLLNRGLDLASNNMLKVPERIWALEQVRGVLAAEEIRVRAEEAYWKKLLELDPNSDLALRELIQIYEARSDFSKMSIYALKLGESSKVLESDVEKIGKAFFKAGDYPSLLKIGTSLNKKFPKNPSSLGYLGIAQQKLKLSDKAIETLQTAIKLKNKNPLVISALSTAHEELADQEIKNKNWIEGMHNYKEALKYNASSLPLKKKTAFLLLDYYSELQFPKNSSTKKDMDYALSLLSDSISSKAPLMSDYAAAIQIAEHSSQPQKHSRLCDKYQNERSSGLSLSLVRACVSIYRSANNESKARALVDLAVSKVKDSSAKQDYLKTLR